MKQCKFNLTWIGQCKKLVEDNEDYCEEHRKLKCCNCGKQATHDCYETIGQMICGAPLCDDCEHTTQSNGCNSMGELPDGYGMHCKKGTQVYKPWYCR